MNYEQANIFYKYLYNKINYKKFKELMLECDEHFTGSYIENKWDDYRVNAFAFTFTWKKFFNAVVDDIALTKYRG